MDDPALDTLLRLGLALAIGLLIGLERGFSQRDEPEGSRVAGLRTFGIIGLSGGLVAVLTQHTHWAVLAAAIPSFVALVLFAFWHGQRRRRDIGATTLFATLATFALGIVAVLGEIEHAAAAAVVLTALLGLKREMHLGIERLKRVELRAAVQLLLISAVILPVLPDKGFGPFEALNPYRIWLMVVLIAGVSFAGYVAIRLFGAGRGVLLTGALGGLVSSTAVALSLAGRAREPQAVPNALAAGIVVASSMMFWRCALIVGAIDLALGLQLAWPLGVAGMVGMAGGALLARGPGGEFEPRDPTSLRLALQFGLLLGAIELLAAALHHWFGDRSLFALAAISGLADVDAISLSVADLAGRGLDRTIAAGAILVAVAVNTAVKVAIVAVRGTASVAWRVALPLFAALAAGAAAILLPPPW
ncbi:MAG: MgtC/SapB family protein [Reyranellaceae bacterium]